jgi:hypothetical protein
MQQAQQQPQLQPQVQMSQMPRARQACGVHEKSPPVFAHFADPMDVEDWLRTVEREMHTAQCNNREKVLYGPHLLSGAAQSLWESYLSTHADPEAITYEEFRDNFRQYHVLEGLMLPLWRARSLGDAMPEESSPTAISFQHPSKIGSTTAGITRLWLGLQSWKGEPLRGRSDIGCTRCGSRYVFSRIPSNKSTI